MLRVSVKKLNKKKLFNIILILLLITFLVIFMFNRPKDYVYSYNINDFKVKESYNKEKKYYSFEIENDLQFSYAISLPYTVQKNLISEIQKVVIDHYTCLSIKGSFNTILCHDGKEQIGINLTPKEMQDTLNKTNNVDKTGTKEKIDLYDLGNFNYFVWNYNEMFMINKNTTKTISLFDKDLYQLNLAIMSKDYLVIPDYNQEHIFKKLYLINNKSGKVDEWTLPEEFYLDGYFLGINKNSVFYVDRKRKMEIEFDSKKKRFRILAKNEQNGKILINDKFEKIAMKELLNDTKKFSNNKLMNYELDNNAIYLSYFGTDEKIRITNQDVKSILTIVNQTVFYLIDDKLYRFNPEDGQHLIMQYFEWNFTNSNNIFINEQN